MLSIIRTVFQVLFKPVSFFKELSGKYSISQALVFYVTLLLLAVAIGAAAVSVMAGKAILASLFLSLFIGAAACIIYIVFSIVSVFLTAAIMHIFVLLFRGKGGYGGTFNILIYSNAAWSLYGILIAIVFLLMLLMKSFGSFLVIAIIALAGSLWLIAIPIIGYRIIHKMGTLRAIGAFFLPTAIFIAGSLLLPHYGINKFAEKAFAGLMKPSGIVMKEKTSTVKPGIPGAGKIKDDLPPPPKPQAPVFARPNTSNYKLSAIGISRSGKPNAIINNNIVIVGGMVGDAKVVSIKKDSVTLLRQDKEIILELQ